MWASILGAIQSVFNFLGMVFGFVFKRSDAKQAKKDIAQKNLDKLNTLVS